MKRLRNAPHDGPGATRTESESEHAISDCTVQLLPMATVAAVIISSSAGMTPKSHISGKHRSPIYCSSH